MRPQSGTSRWIYVLLAAFALEFWWYTNKSALLDFLPHAEDFSYLYRGRHIAVLMVELALPVVFAFLASGYLMRSMRHQWPYRAKAFCVIVAVMVFFLVALVFLGVQGAYGLGGNREVAVA